MDVEEWRGKRLPLLSDIDIGATLARGRWYLVLSYGGCPRCLAVAEEYAASAKSLAAAGTATNVALVEVSGQRGNRVSPDREARGFVTGAVTASRRWIGGLPVAIELDDGVVVGRVALPRKPESGKGILQAGGEGTSSAQVFKNR